VQKSLADVCLKGFFVILPILPINLKTGHCGREIFSQDKEPEGSHA